MELRFAMRLFGVLLIIFISQIGITQSQSNQLSANSLNEMYSKLRLLDGDVWMLSTTISGKTYQYKFQVVGSPQYVGLDKSSQTIHVIHSKVSVGKQTGIVISKFTTTSSFISLLNFTVVIFEDPSTRVVLNSLDLPADTSAVWCTWDEMKDRDQNPQKMLGEAFYGTTEAFLNRYVGKRVYLTKITGDTCVLEYAKLGSSDNYLIEDV